VEQIENLPPSFEWRRKDARTRETREANAVLAALRKRPGVEARVKRFNSEDAATRFAEHLRTTAAMDDRLDVTIIGREVFATVGAASEVGE
jgi:hypothetical protein